MPKCFTMLTQIFLAAMNPPPLLLGQLDHISLLLWHQRGKEEESRGTGERQQQQH